MSSGSIRIIQLPEKSSVNTDDYMAVDSSANGTKKVKFTDLLDNNLSAQNKAADASATGQAISELNTNINNTNVRIDNMINTQQNASVTTLWTGTLDTKNQSVTLSQSIANFDFIDVYVGSVDAQFIRRHVENTINIDIQIQNMSDDASAQFLRWWETGLTISGTTATITKCIKCYWDNFSQAPVVSQATDGAVIIRIDGVKIGHVENDEIVDARVGANDITYPTLGDAIRGQVTDVKSEINDISELLTSTNVYDESAGIPQRFVDETTGDFAIGGDYTAWDYMDISQWDTIVISRYGTLAIALRYALFDENKTYISGALYTGSGTLDEDTRMTYLEIPRNGAKYIRISYLTEFISPNVMFSVGGANLYQPCITDTIPKGTESIKTLENFVMGQKMPMAKADTMVGWSYLALTDNNIQSGDEIIFYGRLTTAMGRIDIGHLTYSPSETGLRLLIDGTNLQWIVNGSPSSPIPHGLSIKDYIRISVKIYRNGNYDIRIDTNGGTYIRNGNTFYNGYYGSVRVDVYSMTLVDCALMQVIPTLMSKVWIFGDSYLSYHTERWSYYMYEDGIKDVLLNGFPGQASASAYDSFTELIKYGTPQYVIWALGMNDGDYVSEINPSWQVRTQNVINACIEKGITPILCTIPNVPNIKNTLKNNFVRASGLQYIDFAKAVNADTEGATWYDGMLSADDTHPTADGAKALYSRFLVDFPQIFNRNNDTLI